MQPGKICYFAPDTAEWMDTEKGYSDFLSWCFNGDLQMFYETLRWRGWEEDAKTINGDQAFSIFPPMWTAGEPVDKRNRKAVPVAEIYSLEIGNATN
jgi:Protein of unknown function DUF2625